jgi:hypothetical protein
MNPDIAVYLGTFAAIAFALKSAILFNIEIKNRASQAFVVVCLCFVLQNAAEFLGYFTYLKSNSLGEFFIHFYMISLFYTFTSVAVFALALTNSAWFRQGRLALYLAATLLTLTYMSNQVVTGFQFIGWSVITEPGPLYWVAMGFVLLCGAFAVAHLLYHYRNNTDLEVRQNARVTLQALSPVMAVAVGVLGLRLLGFNSSSVISLPIATLLFLYMMLLHTNGNLFWLSTKLKSLLAIMKMDRNAPLEVIFREIEKIRIQEALKLTDGQQKTAAEILGVPPSTLNKRLSKYNIDAEQYKKQTAAEPL